MSHFQVIHRESERERGISNNSFYVLKNLLSGFIFLFSNTILN